VQLHQDILFKFGFEFYNGAVMFKSGVWAL